MRRRCAAAAAASPAERRRSVAAPAARLRSMAALLLVAALACAPAPARAAAGLLQETYQLGTVTSLPLPLTGSQVPSATAIIPTLNCPLGANCFPAPVQAVITGGARKWAGLSVRHGSAAACMHARPRTHAACGPPSRPPHPSRCTHHPTGAYTTPRCHHHCAGYVYTDANTTNLFLGSRDGASFELEGMLLFTNPGGWVGGAGGAWP